MLKEPNCFKRKCKHYLGVSQPDGTEMTETNVCAAFPNGIPPEIAYGSDKHTKPHSKQANDIVFEKEDPTMKVQKGKSDKHKTDKFSTKQEHLVDDEKMTASEIKKLKTYWKEHDGFSSGK